MLWAPDGDRLAHFQRLACQDCIPNITIVPTGIADQGPAVLIAAVHPTTCPQLAALTAADQLTTVDVDQHGQPYALSHFPSDHQTK